MANEEGTEIQTAQGTLTEREQGDTDNIGHINRVKTRRYRQHRAH